jgi:hypothetical protein
MWQTILQNWLESCSISQDSMPNFAFFVSKKFPLERWVWWCTPVISTLWRLRQDDHEFEASWGYIVRPCLKKQNKQKFSLGILLNFLGLETEGTQWRPISDSLPVVTSNRTTMTGFLRGHREARKRGQLIYRAPLPWLYLSFGFS